MGGMRFLRIRDPAPLKEPTGRGNAPPPQAVAGPKVNLGRGPWDQTAAFPAGLLSST